MKNKKIIFFLKFYTHFIHSFSPAIKKVVWKTEVQSMSRKANCWDNTPMESFFAVLKTECFYNAGELTVDELMKQIDDYMDYYNRERCSLKLKKLSPVAYRTQLAQSTWIGFYECPRFGGQFTFQTTFWQVATNRFLLYKSMCEDSTWPLLASMRTSYFWMLLTVSTL